MFFCPLNRNFVTMNCLEELKQHYGQHEGYALYRLIMEECFELSHTEILLGKDNQISTENQARLREITERLLKDEPIQYILGYTYFHGHKFHTAPGALIPRPETELLVDAALSIIKEGKTNVPPRVLDIGTGSGCIAISMALTGCPTTAMDISEEALAIASKNAETLNANINFIHENILHPQPNIQQWDIILSNPPYICLHEALEMERNVLYHEPHQALFVPDTDPLIFYRAIASYAASHLASGGWLCLEINQAYPKEMMNLLASFGFKDINIALDQYGKNRIATAHI